MNNTNSKNIVYLVIAGIVLLGVNAWVWMGVQNGDLSPVSNPMLWGAFMVLNTVSLLWAASLLGLQPLVVACAYATGGFLAYRGVQGMVSINIAEVTTAGATYGAIGALAVGNVTTKVRMAFFRREQMPFIFVIVGLLVVDAVLNSQISGAGWDVILRALVFPFVLSGIIIGLVWMVVARSGLIHKSRTAEESAIGETAQVQALEEEETPDASQLMIKIPDAIEEEEGPVEIAAAMTEEPLLKETLSMDEESLVEPSVAVAEEIPEESTHEEHFFPLEIDKGDEFVLPSEEPGLSDLSVLAEDPPVPDVEPMRAMETALDEPIKQAVVVEPEPGEYIVEELVPETEAVPEPVLSDPEPIPSPMVPEPETAPESEDDTPEPGDKKADSSDWLSGHLDLLNKISSNDTK